MRGSLRQHHFGFTLFSSGANAMARYSTAHSPPLCQFQVVMNVSSAPGGMRSHFSCLEFHLWRPLSPSQYPLCHEVVDQRSWDLRSAVVQMLCCGFIEMKRARSLAGFLSPTSSPQGCSQSFSIPQNPRTLWCNSTSGEMSSPAFSLPGS